MAEDTETKTASKKAEVKPRAPKKTGQEEAEAGHRDSTAGLTRPDSEDKRVEVVPGIFKVDH